MDITYITQALYFGIPGLALAIGPAPFLYMANRHAQPRQLLISLSPGLLACGLFVLVCVISKWTVPDGSQPCTAIYQMLLAFCAALIIPAVVLLRRRWVGILHVATLAGIACLWLIGVMTLSHDWV
ncbi:MAG TPA: hypothetical protein VFH12_05195 [Pseudoxanthomonas sp.]|nr:hypothetical protein [Pseudoxanthomonas sp.]